MIALAPALYTFLNPSSPELPVEVNYKKPVKDPAFTGF
jgi:hypothetical protein